MHSSVDKTDLCTVFHDMMLEDLSEEAKKPGELVRCYTLLRNLPLNWEPEDGGQGYWYIETSLIQLSALESIGQYDVVFENNPSYYYVFSRKTDIDSKYGKLLIDRYVFDEQYRLDVAQMSVDRLKNKANNYGYLIWENQGGGNFVLKLTYDKVPPHEQLELPLVFA